MCESITLVYKLCFFTLIVNIGAVCMNFFVESVLKRVRRDKFIWWNVAFTTVKCKNDIICNWHSSICIQWTFSVFVSFLLIIFPRPESAKRCLSSVGCDLVKMSYELCGTKDSSTNMWPTIDVLEKHRGAAALHLTLSHDGNAISKQVSFVHKMSWKDHSASSSLTLKNVPRLSSRLWIHSRRRLVQNYKLTTHKTTRSWNTVKPGNVKSKGCDYIISYKHAYGCCPSFCMSAQAISLSRQVCDVWPANLLKLRMS